MTDQDFTDKCAIAAMQAMIAGKYEDVLITVETAMKAWQFAQAMAVEKERHLSHDLPGLSEYAETEKKHRNMVQGETLTGEQGAFYASDHISMRGDHDSC